MLERMDLEECVLITDTTLVHLAMGCPRLEKLVKKTFSLFLKIFQTLRVEWRISTPCFVLLPERRNEKSSFSPSEKQLLLFIFIKVITYNLKYYITLQIKFRLFYEYFVNKLRHLDIESKSMG